MRLKNNAWTFEGVLSKDQCDQIIAYGNDQKAITATTYKDTVSKLRKSEVAWLYDPWIFRNARAICSRCKFRSWMGFSMGTSNTSSICHI